MVASMSIGTTTSTAEHTSVVCMFARSSNVHIIHMKLQRIYTQRESTQHTLVAERLEGAHTSKPINTPSDKRVRRVARR